MAKQGKFIHQGTWTGQKGISRSKKKSTIDPKTYDKMKKKKGGFAPKKKKTTRKRK